jgi:ribosomal protein L9
MDMKNLDGGYVGLVVILIATAILAFLYIRTYLSPTQTQVVNSTGSIETTTTATALESAHQNLETARAMQEKMNQQNQEMSRALGE